MLGTIATVIKYEYQYSIEYFIILNHILNRETLNLIFASIQISRTLSYPLLNSTYVGRAFQGKCIQED